MLLRPAFANIDLHESPGFLRHFPRCGALTRGQADDYRADFAAFTGPEADVLRNIIAFVKQANHRDAFCHRGRAVIIGRSSISRRVSCRSRRCLAQRNFYRLRFGRPFAARRQHQCAGERRGKDGGPHGEPQLSALPGVQAS
jgi:hypothetical protein